MNDKTVAALNAAELVKLRAEVKKLRTENQTLRDIVAQAQFDNWNLRTENKVLGEVPSIQH